MKLVGSSRPSSATLLVVALATGLGALSTSLLRSGAPRHVTASPTLAGATMTSVTEPAPTPVEPRPAGGDDDVRPPAETIDLDLPRPELEVVATAVSANPQLHMAMLRRGDAAVSRIYRIGDRIEGYVVETIDRLEVTLVAPDDERVTYRLSLYPKDSAPPERVIAQRDPREKDYTKETDHYDEDPDEFDP